jgi:uncharacterized protein
MKKSFLLLLLSFLSTALPAQKIIGNWEGNIEINGNKLPIVFHFTKNNEGKIEGKWDSPKQKAMGLPFSSINNDKDSLHLDIKMISGSYAGKFFGNDSITGTWKQNDVQFPLNFSRAIVNNESPANIAPLHPGEKEIAITSAAGSKLYGTL